MFKGSGRWALYVGTKEKKNSDKNAQEQKDAILQCNIRYWEGERGGGNIDSP